MCCLGWSQLFFQGQASFNFKAAVTICSDFGAQEKKVSVSIVPPSICYAVMELDAIILVFWMLSFRPAFSLSSFTFIKRLFRSSSLYAITVVSSVYLKLLIFLPAILIPACASSSPAFLMIYSVYNLNKQGDNMQTWRTPFPVWNQSVVPCLVLTVASWPAYWFLRRQIRWSGIPISWRFFVLFGLLHWFQNAELNIFLHSWNKSNFVMVYNCFYMLLDLFSQYYVWTAACISGLG